MLEKRREVGKGKEQGSHTPKKWLAEGEVKRGCDPDICSRISAYSLGVFHSPFPFNPISLSLPRKVEQREGKGKSITEPLSRRSFPWLVSRQTCSLSPLPLFVRLAVVESVATNHVSHLSPPLFLSPFTFLSLFLPFHHLIPLPFNHFFRRSRCREKQ